MFTNQPEWFKSSYSGQNGNCVEARRRADGMDLRDSKVTAGPILKFDGENWSAFMQLISDREN